MSGSNEPIDIYYFPPSAPSRAALMLIKALGLKHNVKTVVLPNGEHMKPEFLKLNPLHTIPVIEDNGFTLYESHVIMKYLVDVYGKDDSLFPKDPKKGAIVNLRCYFSACYLFPRFAEYHVPTMFHGVLPSEEGLKKLKEVLEHLNGFLDNQMYVAGPTLTVADFANITLITTIDAAGSVDLRSYPNIWMWYQRCKKSMEEYGFEEVNQAGASAFGQMYKTKLSSIK
ncbi:glutathione S-transferase 1-like [Sitophilus oryzae]|uniref:Glutathione S-transferase 1-like n=1 Tax=Sitophilus oryzae TaxID=7048 RepID=A0A6J2XN32_SITOR|nr:glutathione S-transferase 1-like [Sitophilus oryzae]